MPDQTDTQAIKDELDIQRVLAEYCLRLEINTLDEWLDLFTGDTVYEVHRKILRGRKEVAETLSLAPHGVHIGGPVRIERDGDTAKTIQSYAFYADEERFSNNGWYYRTLVRTESGWKISHTVVKMQKRKKPESASS
jgi:SnoaL-like domain